MKIQYLKALRLGLSAPVLVLAACSVQPKNLEPFLPYLEPTPAALEGLSQSELENLQLVATNLVSALVQIPETNAISTRLQVSRPATAFGNLIIRALEDAGYSIQHVSADQGQHYVRYGRRISETETGRVVDYDVEIGKVLLRREYITNSSGIFPSSLMSITGTRHAADVQLDDNIFREQGGNDLFISGIKTDDTTQRTNITTVQVKDYDQTPDDKRTKQEFILARARQRLQGRTARYDDIELNNYDRARRTVLIFDNRTTNVMGRGNKRAISLLAREFQKQDLYSVTACTDADGQDDSAMIRAVRVQEEFVSHGIAPSSVVFAPCIRASFRHTSDNSPVPVTIEQLRKIQIPEPLD